MSANTILFLKGLGRTILLPILYVIGKTASEGSLVFNLKDIAIVAISAAVGYIITKITPPLSGDTK